MNIPSTPGWEHFDTEDDGELRRFTTSVKVQDTQGNEIEYGGIILAYTYEEAVEIAASIEFPPTEVRGVLGGRVHQHIFN